MHYLDTLIQGSMIDLMEINEIWEAHGLPTPPCKSAGECGRPRRYYPIRYQRLVSLDKSIATSEGDAVTPVDLLVYSYAIDPIEFTSKHLVMP